MWERGDVRNIQKFILAGAVSMIAVACGASNEATEASAPPPDAEAPYAEPAAPPPAHAEAETLKSTGAGSADEFAAEVAEAVPAEKGKVDNVTENAANTASIKQAAATEKDDLKSPVSDDDSFGALVGDAERGGKIFVQCRACHAVEEGQNRVGPHLYNIVGRAAGSVEGFRYSKANAKADIIWTEDALFAYLENPRAYMPGTSMVFVGVKREQDRADLVAYLATLSD